MRFIKFGTEAHFINYYKQNMSSPMCQISGILPKIMGFFNTKSSRCNNFAGVSQKTGKSSLLFKMYINYMP